jgi:hypothetical protein
MPEIVTDPQVGTNATRKVAMPINNSVAISAALRPMRSP